MIGSRLQGSTVISRSAEIPSLNGIRAVSILIVVASHAGAGHYIPGGFGVTIFFFLSGYLITTLLLAEYASTKRIHVPHFFARRFLRLMPPLAVTLVLAYTLTASGLLGGGISLSGFLAQMFYFANYYTIFFGGPVPDGTGILWSLAVEEHFYIIYPLLMLLLLGRLRPQLLSMLLLGVCALVLAWRMMLVFGYSAPESRTFFSTDTRIDSIMFGCVFAISQSIPTQALMFRNERFRFAGVLAGIALLIFTLLYRNPDFRETARYSLQGIALIPMFHYAIYAQKSLAFRVLNSRLMRTLGVYSYSIYLIHYVFLSLIEQNLTQLADSKVFLLGTALILSVAYAKFIDEVLDEHIRPLRRKLH